MADSGQAAVAAALANEVGGQALGALRNSLSMVTDYIQRGPEGMSWLCFMGGLVTFAFGVLGFIDIFDAVLDPLYYLVNAYQMIFGLATCIIEAPLEWVNQSNQLKKAQAFIYEFSKFLTTFGGRGLFYLFQGSLALSLTGISLQFVLGCYMFFLGVLCIGAQYGLKVDSSPGRMEANSPGLDRDSDYIKIGP